MLATGEKEKREEASKRRPRPFEEAEKAEMKEEEESQHVRMKPKQRGAKRSQLGG